MKKIFCMLTCLLICLACNNKNEDKIPANVFSKEKMAAVLLDVHMYEAYINVNPVGIPHEQLISNRSVTNEILVKQKITRDDFIRSFDYYTRNPEKFVEVYDVLLIELSKMQAKVAAEKDTVQAVKPK